MIDSITVMTFYGLSLKAKFRAGRMNMYEKVILSRHKALLVTSAAFLLVSASMPGYAQDVGFEPPPPSPEILGGMDTVPAPSEDEVLVPVPVSEGLPVGGGANETPPVADVTGQDVPLPTELPNPVAAPEIAEDVFFDAEALVPTGEMGRKSGPKKVDPRTQPGSRLVIVNKGAPADSKTAMLTSAERAMKLGRYDSALEIYDRLYAENPREPNVLLGRALTLQHLGRSDEAVSAYDQLLGIKPDNVAAQINMLGMMAGQYPAVALKRLADLSEKHPRDIGIIAQMAFIHAKMNNYQDAIRYLGMAASMQPQNANHVYNMAIIADRAGAKKEAILYYEQALEVDTLYGSGKSIPREQVFERLARIR